MSNEGHKTLVIIGCSITTPPLAEAARRQIGMLLRFVQAGESLGLPISRPMSVIGPNCHELRLSDEQGEWRVFYHIGIDVVQVLDVLHKTTRSTPKGVIKRCQRRLANNPE